MISRTVSRYILAPLSIAWLLLYAWAGAAGKCEIAQGPSKELLEYMERTEALWAKISDEASKQQCGDKKDGSNSAWASAKEAGSSFVGSFNGVLDYSNFISSTEFFIGTIVRSEVPPSINRDHARLASMLDGMKRSYYSVYNQCAQGVVIKENLSDDPTYTTQGKKISTVLDEILANHIKMLNFYRETVVGISVMSDPSFILVGDNQAFKDALKKLYGSKAFETCVVEGGAWDRITSSIKRLGTLGWGIESGMQEWEDAWELASSERTDRMTVRLKFDKSSWEAGLDWGMEKPRGDAVMLGLESFGSQNKHEGISGFVKNVGERVYKWVNAVGRMFDDFKQTLRTPQTTDEYLRQYQEMKAVKDDIFDDIKVEYITARELMGSENQTMELNVSSLLSTHTALQEANKKLQPMIKIAEQTCNQQGQGEGNCSYK